MADSKCHHPIEFLFPEYANDSYTIQRDARSIGFFSWVIGLNSFEITGLRYCQSIHIYYCCNFCMGKTNLLKILFTLRSRQIDAHP